MKGTGNGMEIKVRVATILLNKADPPIANREFACFLDEGSDVKRLVSELGIPFQLVGSVTVNRKRSRWDRELEEGDTVAIVPAISGG